MLEERVACRTCYLLCRCSSKKLMRRREEECERLCDAKPVLVSERFEY